LLIAARINLFESLTNGRPAAADDDERTTMKGRKRGADHKITMKTHKTKYPAKPKQCKPQTELSTLTTSCSGKTKRNDYCV
jgi:hypothetical protein